MPVSIKDIARLAGVSHSTVSRALRNSPLIPAITAHRIQQIARESGYTASAVARSLVTRKTEAIGVVVTSIADPFNGELVGGIEDAAKESGYSVILSTSQTDPAREMAVVRSFQERRVDGILVASSRVGALYLPMLEELQIPMVLINNQRGSDFVHSVAFDNKDGTYRAVKHLIGLGHRRIAYLGDHSGFHSDTDRLSGVMAAIEEHGLTLPENWIVQGDGKLNGAMIAARSMLAGSDRPSAVVCYNDMSALGLLQVAEENGISVPHELSVTGFDDIFFAALSRPALTTIRQPQRSMGRQAVHLLLQLLSGTSQQKAVVIRGELILRNSTAPFTA